MTARGISLRSTYDMVLRHATGLLGERRLLTYWRVVVLTFLFLAAFGIRMLYAGEPPLNFHATRQYRSLIIARGFYFDSLPVIPEWQREVARISQQRQGMLEPPIMEFLVSQGYRVLGGEQLWLPRLLSSLFWLLGGFFLYRIGTKIATADASLFGTAIYLFLPFAVIASRSFQPDPLMVMLMLASVFAVLRYADAQSTTRLATAAAISALAVIVKPSGVFVIVSTFLALAAVRQGLWQAVLSRTFLVFLGVTLAPAMLIYVYGVLTGTFLVGEAQKTLLPQLWISPFFWRSWFINIEATVGLTSFIGALLGVLMFSQGPPRALMIGLWAGYGLFGLALSYNFATHDYYQLQFIPIVGLSLGPLMALVVNHVIQAHPQLHWRMALWSILFAALLLSLADARSRLVNPEAERKVRVEQEIGQLVNHSIKTIFLSGDYGVPLEYHGLLSGSPWPLASDLEWDRLSGVPAQDARERFSTWFAEQSPEYFIVEDLTEFEQQVDLKQFLAQNFALLAQSEHYLIFDLRQRKSVTPVVTW